MQTGLSGIAGNKGGCAIRFDFSNTSICFITAHLAAGFANYDERNRDYETIDRGLRFQKNRSIADHDTVIWLGDFNYRIGLGNQIVRDLVSQRDFQKLYDNDQVFHDPVAPDLSSLTRVVEPANDRWKSVPVLFRGAYWVCPNLQIRCRHRSL